MDYASIILSIINYYEKHKSISEIKRAKLLVLCGSLWSPP